MDRIKPETLINVGVDYLMATTAKTSTIDKWHRLWTVYYKGLGDNAFRNLQERTWKGYHTKELPGFMIGWRKDGAIIRLTGETASLLYQTVEPMISKVTRIDLQCTYDFTMPYPDLARLYKEMLIETGYHKTLAPLIDSETGQTLYLGSFGSEHFGRIYDRAKSEKLDTIGKRWRYEVVWRNAKAQQVYRTLRQHYKMDDKIEAMYSIVHRWYADHWCDLPMGKPPQEIDLVMVGAKIKTEETQLNYLRSSIKPYIWRLIEAGTSEEDILDALGFAPKTAERLRMLSKSLPDLTA